MKLELRDARVSLKSADLSDSGLATYRVSAFDQRFGDRLIIADFGFDNTHEGGFYKKRAEFMANTLANQINA